MYEKILKTLLFSLTVLILLHGVSALSEGEVETFGYTGSPQEFEVPQDGAYELRVWGAGTESTDDGIGPAYGGYAEGTITLRKGKILNLYAGGEGQRVGGSQHSAGGGWNGGGGGCVWNSYPGAAVGGGGATDIRINGTSLEDRVIVAGGAGGSTDNTDSRGGDGGGVQGGDAGDGYDYGYGGTQTEMGEIKNTPRGKGGACTDLDSGWVGGGGGGWYGGGLGADHGGSGGGSGYVDGSLQDTSMNSGVNSGHGRVEIELVDKDAGSFSICDYRGPFNECIMNQTNQLNNQQYNFSSIFEARKSAVFEAFEGQATLNITNSSSISGLWSGGFFLKTENPEIKPGAEFRPKNGDIVIGK